MNYNKEYDENKQLCLPVNKIEINCSLSDIIDTTGLAELHNFCSWDKYNMIQFNKQFKSNCILYKSKDKIIDYDSAIHIDFSQLFNIQFDGHAGNLDFSIKIKYKANKYDDYHYFLIKLIVIVYDFDEDNFIGELTYQDSLSFIPNFNNEEYNTKAKWLSKTLKQSNYHLNIHNCTIENNNTINQSNQIKIEFDEDLPF